MEEMKKREYYYCPRCNKAVSIKLKKCDTPECDKKFTSGKERPYTWDEVQEKIKLAAEKNTDVKDEKDCKQEELTMVCPVCDKRYGRSVSKCADCGAYVVYGNFDNSSMPEYSNTLEESLTDKMEELQSDVGMLDDYRWKLIVRRFYNQLERDSRELYVDSDIFLLGRMPILDANLFGSDKKSVHNSINNVSRYNAMLINRDGRLFVKVDDVNVKDKPADKKAPVYIDGKRLPVGVEHPIVSGQKILMGDRALTNLNGCVEYEVVELEDRTQQNATGNMSNEQFEELMKQIADVKQKQDDMSKKQEETLEHASHIRKTTDSLAVNITDFVNIQTDGFVDVRTLKEELKSYLSKVEEVGGELEDEEYLAKYLDDFGDYREIIKYIDDEEYDALLDAAKIEYAISAAGIKVNYSGPFVYIGQMVEIFLDITVRKMIDTYMGNRNIRKDSQVTVSQELVKASTIGEFTFFYAYTNKETGEVGCKANGEFFFKKLAKTINSKQKNKSNEIKCEDIRDVFLKIEEFKNIRNNACHAGKDNTGEKVKIDYEKYVEAKELAFKNGFIMQIKKWYELLF